MFRLLSAADLPRIFTEWKFYGTESTKTRLAQWKRNLEMKWFPHWFSGPKEPSSTLSRVGLFSNQVLEVQGYGVLESDPQTAMNSWFSWTFLAPVFRFLWKLLRKALICIHATSQTKTQL